jgi:hypothetical protein
MTAADYLINAVLVLLVARQVRERRVDRAQAVRYGYERGIT